MGLSKKREESILNSCFAFTCALTFVFSFSLVTSPKPSNDLQISVNSNNKDWVLVQHVCVSLNECLLSLSSGDRFASISAKSTGKNTIVVSNIKTKPRYKYFKYYVASKHNNQDTYKVTNLSDYPGLKEYVMSENGVRYSVVIVPTKFLTIPSTDFISYVQ